MGHHRLRKDKTCLNCFHVVESNFCPNCGQENIEPKQSFHYLFTHFVEDLTHYDGSFWKTIKNLLFKPGYLTKEYLEGKRKRFVPPVKLYIFISFVTFFLPTILPEVALFGENPAVAESNFQQKAAQEISNVKKKKQKFNILGEEGIRDFKQLDSIQKVLPEGKKHSKIQMGFARNFFKIMDKASHKEFLEKAQESIIHNLPKVLFIYMPLFALFLWLFHNKKKWYYFDCGIFTLHYFSFLLLTITISLFFEWLLTLFYYVGGIVTLVRLILMGYAFFYFFRSHSNVFGEDKAMSRLKGTVLFFINMILISIVLTCLFFYTLVTVH